MRNKIKENLLLLVLFSVSIYGYGQGNTVSMPTVIPPSPEAASIAKYVDTKINENLGMVSYQIPIYQINEGNINLPISLNYQSGGFKVTESSSSVGLGWSLNAGGVITRSMNGLPDDEGGDLKGFLKLSSEVTYDYLSHGPKDQTRYSYLQSIGQGCFDAQPDIFNFNFNGYSGKFHFDWDGNLVIASESEITITPIQNNGSLSKITGWTVQTPDGLTYTFTSTETTSNVKSGTNLCYLAQDGYISSWYLTEISDPFNSRKIFLEYKPYLLNDYDVYFSSSRSHLISGDPQYCGGNFSGQSNSNLTNISITGKSLSRIYSNSSPVEISFISGTKKVMKNYSDNYYAISEIQIKNNDQNKIVKRFELTHNYATGRLTLNSIQEFGNASGSIPPYEFFYHGSLPGRTSYQRDHWGFANDNPTNNMIPTYFLLYSGGTASFGGGDRSPSFEGSRSGVLYKVKYPTGGYDQYTFEQNTYGKIGHLQLDEYKTENVVREVQATGDSAIGCTGTLTDTDSTSFTIIPNPNNLSEKRAVKVYGFARKYTEDYFSAGKAPKVTIYDSNNNIAFRLSLISNNNNDFNEYILLAPGDYTMIAEATWRNCENTSRDQAKLNIKFDNPINQKIYEKPIGGVRVKTLNKYDQNGAILLSQEYRYTDENGYSSGIINKEPIYLFNRESQAWVVSGNGGYNTQCQYTIALDSDRSNLGITNGNQVHYKQVTVVPKSGSNDQNGKTILNFSGGANIVHDRFPFPPPIDYSFSSGRILSSQIKNSVGNTLQETVNDYQTKENLTNAIKVEFKGGAILGEDNFLIARYPIRMAHIKIKKQETKLHTNGSEQVTTREFKYDSSLRKLKEELFYNSDKNHKQVFYYPEEYSLLTGLSQNESSYYQSLVDQFRIGQPIQTETFVNDVQVARQRTIYGSFSGNVLAKNLQISKHENPLENRIVYHRYDTDGNPLEVSKADGIHITYIWSYNKMYPVAKIENATFSEVATALGISETSLMSFDATLISSLNGLRTSLPKALVSTYTYDPLIGVTSMIDPRGYKMTYHYDAFNRLQFVKDEDGNLVNENQYNYKH